MCYNNYYRNIIIIILHTIIIIIDLERNLFMEITNDRCTNISRDGSKKRVSLMIDTTTWQQLKILAAEQDTPVSTLVSDAVRDTYGI